MTARNDGDEQKTEELAEELREAERATDFLDSHDLKGRKLDEYLNELLEQKGLERREVVKRTGMDGTYCYDLFKGIKEHPGRNKVLQIAFAMGLTWRECDRLLQVANKGRLYPKERRDAIIMFFLNRHATVDEVNMELYRRGEKTLMAKD